MSSKCKRLLCMLILISMLTTIVMLFLTIHITPYTNLSDAQVSAQEDRWIGLQVKACQQVGGTWQAGFSTAGCNVQYEQPDASWYIPPKENPWYERWQILEVLMVPVGLALFVAIMCLLCSLWD